MSKGVWTLDTRGPEPLAVCDTCGARTVMSRRFLEFALDMILRYWPQKKEKTCPMDHRHHVIEVARHEAEGLRLFGPLPERFEAMLADMAKCNW